jgi:protein-tyrosine phosphatase
MAEPRKPLDVRMVDRNLNWDGWCNVRDLGGFRTVDGRRTRWGAVVRSAEPRCSSAGWAALEAHGIQSILDLRNRQDWDQGRRATHIQTVNVPLEQDLDETDLEFSEWGARGLRSTPLYYKGFLTRWPDRCAAAVAAIARARPGGVLIHCRRGRDRTGLVVMLLLALVGVAPEDIAADYELSNAELVRRRVAELGHHDDFRAINELLARENTSTRTAILSTLEWLDADAYLRSAGLTGEDLAALRARLIDAD